MDPSSSGAARLRLGGFVIHGNNRSTLGACLGEEMAELVTACADGDSAQAAEEAADVLYHLMVALRGVGVGLGEVRQVLDARAKK